jgi:very-short-patch-repair endonuclease
LWAALRNRTLVGFKFRRQHPIGVYVVDFACAECKVVLEVDGESHLDNRRYDEQRTKEIELEGWLVMRFWNTEVYDEFESVIEAIYRTCLANSS